MTTMSEGHASAQRINASLTGDPYLLQPVGRLHRVDTSQLPAGVDGAAAWHCRTDRAADDCTHDCAQGDVCTCRPQPAQDQQPSQRRSLLWWLVAAGVALLLWGAQALLGTPHEH